jgi:hypothetical protein
MELGTRAGNRGDLGRRWKTTVVGRAKMVVGTGRQPEMENGRWLGFCRRWRTTVVGHVQWSTVGRKWVDGEREGKFGGKLGGNRNEKMGVLQWFWFQNLKFLFLFFLKKNKKKSIKIEMALST